jgi:hypothetical protein
LSVSLPADAVSRGLVDGHPISNLYPTNQRPAGAAILNLI